MTAADPDAVWVDSGWRFLANQNWWMGPKHDGARMKAFLHAIPKGKHIARDLAAEFAPVWQGSESFYGTDWIWVSPKASLRPFALAVRPYSVAALHRACSRTLVGGLACMGGSTPR